MNLVFISVIFSVIAFPFNILSGFHRDAPTGAGGGHGWSPCAIHAWVPS